MRFRRFSKSNEKENLGESKPETALDSEENLHQVHDTSDMLTLEGLRRTYNSCSNCGVSWYDDHVSLDCSECGGYSMSRPCPACNGECGNKWRRDVKASNVKKQALWHGTCSLDPTLSMNPSPNSAFETSIDGNANYQRYRCLAENTSHPTHLLNRQ